MQSDNPVRLGMITDKPNACNVCPQKHTFAAYITRASKRFTELKLILGKILKLTRARNPFKGFPLPMKIAMKNKISKRCNIFFFLPHENQKQKTRDRAVHGYRMKSK